MRAKPNLLIDLIQAAILEAKREQMPFVAYLLEMALMAAATDSA